MKIPHSNPEAWSNALLSGVLSTLVFPVLALFPGQALPDETDGQAPITLEADFVEIDDQKKEATFKGNVILRQGTLEIHADQIFVIKNEKGFERGRATGDPARFRQKLSDSHQYIEGTASRIEYDGTIGKLEMFENARLTRNEDRVEGDYISYNMLSEFFQIRGNNSERSKAGESSGRVKAVIKPKLEN